MVLAFFFQELRIGNDELGIGIFLRVGIDSEHWMKAIEHPNAQLPYLES